MPHDSHLVEQLGLVSGLLVSMSLLLSVAELFEHAQIAVGGHERRAALLDLRGHCLPLLIGGLTLDLENHFVAGGVGQAIDVDGSRARSIERPARRVGKLAIDPGETIDDQLLCLLGLRKLGAPLIAPRLAKPQQGREPELKSRHEVLSHGDKRLF